MSRVWGIAVSAVLVILLGAITGAAVTVLVLPRITDGAALTVLTGSMTPEIPVGSVVLVRPVDTATLRVGDVAPTSPSPARPSSSRTGSPRSTPTPRR